METQERRAPALFEFKRFCPVLVRAWQCLAPPGSREGIVSEPDKVTPINLLHEDYHLRKLTFDKIGQTYTEGQDLPSLCFVARRDTLGAVAELGTFLEGGIVVHGDGAGSVITRKMVVWTYINYF